MLKAVLIITLGVGLGIAEIICIVSFFSSWKTANVPDMIGYWFLAALISTVAKGLQASIEE